MPVVKTPSTQKTPAVAKPKPVVKKGKAVMAKTEPVKVLIPVNPERKKPSSKRKRLSKAFSRPLDKTLRHEHVVRDRISFPEVEYDQLVELKKNLTDQGMVVKKSQLVRAGLLLLSELTDDELKTLLEKVPAVS